MFMRQLGRSGVQVSALGLGCWAIGGPYWENGQPRGWGQVDDDEALRAIQCGLDLGVNFFDTADTYGAGHSERLLGRALAGKRDRVVIATKFGFMFDEATRQVIGRDASPAYIRRACVASLERLNTDYIDLYQFHLGDYGLKEAGTVRDVLEELVAAGQIRAYAWSTDDPERVRVFAQGPHCTAVQNHLNLFDDNAAMLTLCAELDLASVNRGPLAMGLLSGKFTTETSLPADDVRHQWNFREGRLAERLETLAGLRQVLTRDGRTLAQAALGWLWARSERTIPIPGFKTVAQVEEDVGALQFGPLTAEQMQQINQLLGRAQS
jgi:aryl-alcohol dehydrogenase-like predicted oxidoreductase